MLDFPSIANSLVAFATACLAWVTYGVAKTSRDSLLMQSQALLAFERISLELAHLWALGPKPFPPVLRIGLVLSNPGKVAVSYEVEEISATLNGASCLSLEALLCRGGRIFPDHSETFFLPTAALDAPLHAGTAGTVVAKIIFWADPKSKQRLTLKQNLNIKSVDPQLSWEWLSIEAPVYEICDSTRRSKFVNWIGRRAASFGSRSSGCE
jgi:hypothetical protein